MPTNASVACPVKNISVDDFQQALGMHRHANRCSINQVRQTEMVIFLRQTELNFEIAMDITHGTWIRRHISKLVPVREHLVTLLLLESYGNSLDITRDIALHLTGFEQITAHLMISVMRLQADLLRQHPYGCAKLAGVPCPLLGKGELMQRKDVQVNFITKVTIGP